MEDELAESAELGESFELGESAGEIEEEEGGSANESASGSGGDEDEDESDVSDNENESSATTTQSSTRFGEESYAEIPSQDSSAPSEKSHVPLEQRPLQLDQLKRLKNMNNKKTTAGKFDPRKLGEHEAQTFGLTLNTHRQLLIVEDDIAFFAHHNTVDAFNMATQEKIMTYSVSEIIWEIEKDHHLLYVACDDDTMYTFNVKNGEVIRKSRCKTHVFCVRSSADKKFIFTGEEDGRVGRVRRNKSNQKARVCYENVRQIEVVGPLLFTLHSPETRRAAGQPRGALVVWLDFDPKAPKIALLVTRSVSGYTCMAVDRVNNAVIVGCEDGAVQSFDFQGRTKKWEKREHLKEITALAVEGITICSASLDNTIRVWNGEKGTVQRVIGGHEKRIVAIALKTGILTSTCFDGSMRLIDVAIGKEMKKINLDRQVALNLRIAADKVIAATFPATIRGFDRSTGEELFKMTGTFQPHNIAVDFAGNRLFEANEGTELIEWNLKTSSQAKTFVGHTEQIAWVEFFEGRLYTCCAGYDSDKTIRVWDPESAFQLFKLDMERAPRSFKLFGYYMYVGHTQTFDRVSGELSLMQLSKDKTKLVFVKYLKGHKFAPITCMHVDEVTKFLYTGGGDREVLQWDLTTHTVRNRFTPGGGTDYEPAATLSLMTNDDGSVLYTGENTNRINVWDTKEVLKNSATGKVLSKTKPLSIIETTAEVTSLLKYEHLLYAGLANGLIIAYRRKDRVYDVDQIFEDHTSPIIDMELSGGRLYSCSNNISFISLPIANAVDISCGLPMTKEPQTGLSMLYTRYGRLFGFGLSTVLILFDFIQLVTYVLQPGVKYHDNSEKVHKYISEFGLNIDFNYYAATFGGACGVVGLLLLILFLTPTVTNHRFFKPNSAALTALWTIMQVLARVIVSSVFLPIMTTFLRAFACTNTGLGYYTLNADPVVTCWSSPTHIAFMFFAAFMLAIYVPIVMRLAFVQNMLQHVTLKARIWDAKDDINQPVVEHPFSFERTGAYYYTVVLINKTVLSAMTVFGVDAIRYLAVGLAIAVVNAIVTYAFPPFIKLRANKLRAGLDASLVWAFVSALFTLVANNANPSSQAATRALIFLCVFMPCWFFMGYHLFGAYTGARALCGGTVSQEKRAVARYHGGQTSSASDSEEDKKNEDEMAAELKNVGTMKKFLLNEKESYFATKGAAVENSNTCSVDLEEDEDEPTPAPSYSRDS